jgi:hypothetical protein
MNPSTRSDVLSETDQGKEPCGNLRGDTLLREHRPNGPPPQNPPGPCVPDERALETFVGGAGI